MLGTDLFNVYGASSIATESLKRFYTLIYGGSSDFEYLCFEKRPWGNSSTEGNYQRMSG